MTFFSTSAGGAVRTQRDPTATMRVRLSVVAALPAPEISSVPSKTFTPTQPPHPVMLPYSSSAGWFSRFAVAPADAESACVPAGRVIASAPLPSFRMPPDVMESEPTMDISLVALTTTGLSELTVVCERLIDSPSASPSRVPRVMTIAPPGATTAGESSLSVPPPSAMSPDSVPVPARE